MSHYCGQVFRQPDPNRMSHKSMAISFPFPSFTLMISMPGNFHLTYFRIANLRRKITFRRHRRRYPHRFEETNERSTGCKTGEKCIGGYARAVALIKKLMEVRKHTNPIYLNAGDNFQGTIWYSVGRWNVTSHFLNLLKADAIVRMPYYSSLVPIVGANWSQAI